MVVWQDLVDFVPEGVRVVAVREVAEFVDDDVIDHGERRHHAFPVEGEFAGR